MSKIVRSVFELAKNKLKRGRKWPKFQNYLTHIYFHSRYTNVCVIWHLYGFFYFVSSWLQFCHKRYFVLFDYQKDAESQQHQESRRKKCKARNTFKVWNIGPSVKVLKFEISAQVFVHKIPFFRYSASALKHSKFFDYCWLLFISNVTRLGDLLHFGQLFKARGNNYFPQIANTF